MPRQVLNRGTIANDGTGDTLRAATLKIQQNFEELYTKLGDGTNLMTLIDFDSATIKITGDLSFDTLIQAPNSTAQRTISFPDQSGTLVLETGTQTLTNKTLTNPTVSDLDLKDSSGTYVYQFRTAGLSNDVIVRIPTISDSAEIGLTDATQTLTNKTLTSPVITSPDLTGPLNDENGAEIVGLTATSAAVNYVNVANAATGNDPVISAVGDDTNIDLRLSGKGVGGIRIQSALIYANEEITASGAVNINVPVSFINNSGSTNFSLTLADGSQDGIVKHVVVKSINSGISHTLTPTNLTGGSTLTFDSTGDAATLIWSDGTWIVINNSGATLA